MALAEHQENMIWTFLGVAEGSSYDIAHRHLEAAGWDLEDALCRFFLGGADHAAAPDHKMEGNEDVFTLFPDLAKSDDDMDYEYEEEEEETEQDYDEDVDDIFESFPSFYELKFRGSFWDAKQEARRKNKWLLVNLQDFSSDNISWNEKIAMTVKENFIFFRESAETEDGDWVQRHYNLETFPVVMVIEPLTGRKIQVLFGAIPPEDLLETLLSCSESTPVDYCMKPYIQKEEKLEDLLEHLKIEDEVVNNVEEVAEDVNDVVKDPVYPPLPEEPVGDCRYSVCKVGVRLPGGQRIQRKFLTTDSIQLLWSFICSEMEEASKRPFGVGFSTPGRFDCLDYNSGATLGESGVGNCMLSFKWD